MRALFVWCALACALVAGCGDSAPSGYGIQFDLVIDPAISDGDLKRITTLELESMSSFEPWYHRYPTNNLFSERDAKMVYRPAAPSGSVSFEARVRDDKDVLVGVGEVRVDLVPGKVVGATVHLTTPPPIVIPPDMASTDMAMPDM